MIEDIKKMQQKLTSLEKDRIDALSLYNANQTLQKEVGKSNVIYASLLYACACESINCSRYCI